MTTPQMPPGFEMVREDVLGTSMLVFRDRARSLNELLEASARYGDRHYLVESAERRLTFAEHDRCVRAVAAQLHELGVERGSRVAILGANSLEWVVAFWATVALGGVVIALNAWWAAEEIAYGLADAEPHLLLADRKRLDRLGAAPSVPVAILETDVAGWCAGDAPPLPDVEIDEDDAAVILYTSGTTGRSKGAVLSHRNIIAFVRLQELAVASRLLPEGVTMPPPSVFTTNPLFHVSGLHSAVISHLVLGGTVVWQLGRFDPVEVMATIERERCLSWNAVPTAIWRVVNHEHVEKYDLTSLMHVGGGGAAYSPALQERMSQVFGETVSSGVGYGLTECGGLATIIGGPELREYPTSVGRPLPTVDVEVRGLDGERLPDGEEGEICIRSPLVMLGYWHNPDATAAVLDADRWLRTGDLGWFDDGRLYLASRRYDLILRGGENVYPVEIENALEAHPDVDECVVVGVPHDELGQEVTAVVALRPAAVVGTDELARHVAAHLAAYKVPSRWELRTDPLPRTVTGKVLRADVLSELADQVT